MKDCFKTQLNNYGTSMFLQVQHKKYKAAFSGEYSWNPGAT